MHSLIFLYSCLKVLNDIYANAEICKIIIFWLYLKKGLHLKFINTTYVISVKNQCTIPEDKVHGAGHFIMCNGPNIIVRNGKGVREKVGYVLYLTILGDLKIRHIVQKTLSEMLCIENMKIYNFVYCGQALLLFDPKRFFADYDDYWLCLVKRKRCGYLKPPLPTQPPLPSLPNTPRNAYTPKFGFFVLFCLLAVIG